jgi:branched-chain amino acid transport system permease protein
VVDNIVLFCLLGIGSGAVIAGLSLSLVLNYRGSGTINLGAGAVAMVSMYCFWALQSGYFGGYKFGLAPALLITLAVAIIVGLIIETLAFRPLRTSPPLAKLVASLGVLLVAQSAIQLTFGDYPKQPVAFLPQNAVHLLGVNIPVVNFILAGIVVVVTVVLTALYKWSSFGLQTRAAFESEASAMWIGLAPARLSMINTLLASVVAGALGVLAAPITSIDPTFLPLEVVPALAAALLARFTSFWVAALVGLLIGMGGNLLFYLQTMSWFPKSGGVPIPGVEDLLIFILMVVALLWRGSSLPTRGDVIERGLPAVPRPRNPVRWSVILGVVGVLALIGFPYNFRQALINSIIGVVLVLSLVVITGYMGQMSLVQLSLSGVTGFTMADLAQSFGIGFPLGPIIGVAVATVLGLLIGASALRVRGIQLAVASLAGAVAISEFWFNNPSWGAGTTGARISQPTLFGVDIGSSAGYRGLDGSLPSPVLGFIVLAFAILLCLLVVNLRRTRFGQQMVAARSNERAAAALGVNVRRLKLTAFGVSSFIAGMAGVMYAYNFSSLSTDRFSALTALSLISYAYIGGISMVSGAVFGGLLTVQALIPYAWQDWFGLSGTWAILVGGVFLVFNLIFYPAGAAGANYKNRLLREQRKALGIPPPRWSVEGLFEAALGKAGRAAATSPAQAAEAEADSPAPVESSEVKGRL